MFSLTTPFIVVILTSTSVPSIDLLTNALVAPPTLAQDSEPELSWKDPKGADVYSAAKKAFDDGDYKVAEAGFKAAGKLAKGKTSNYVKAMRGGSRLLLTITEQAARGQKRKALQLAQQQTRLYTGTPVKAKLIAFADTVSKEVYHVLEDFEMKSNRYSEKYGKSWIRDEKFVKEGQQSLKWITTGQDAELKIKKVPRNVSQYEALGAWVYFTKKGPGFDMIFKSKGTAKTAVSQKRIDNAFFFAQSGFKGWKWLEIPLKKFKPQGDAAWSRIEDFRIQFKGKRKITLYVDGIVLIKKDAKK